MGLAGFGIALVALAFLPYLLAPADAVILLTIYAAVFSVAMLLQLRRDVEPRAITDLLIGTIAGTPLGVWGLAALPASSLNRLIGLMLVVAFVVEASGLYPRKVRGRHWGSCPRGSGCSCAADRGADYPDCVAFHCSMLFSIWRAWPSR